MKSLFDGPIHKDIEGKGDILINSAIVFIHTPFFWGCRIVAIAGDCKSPLFGVRRFESARPQTKNPLFAGFFLPGRGSHLRGFRGGLESSVDVFALQKPRRTAGPAGRTAKSGPPRGRPKRALRHVCRMGVWGKGIALPPSHSELEAKPPTSRKPAGSPESACSSFHPRRNRLDNFRAFLTQ